MHFTSDMKLSIIGPPGSGKGTVTERLVKEFSLQHIYPGKMLRDSRDPEIKKQVDAGVLVDNALVVKLVEKKATTNFVLDGFPRSMGQVELMSISLDKVIYIHVTDKEVMNRFLGRRVCSKGHTFHVTLLPPKKKGICDYDSLPLTKRKDDTKKGIMKRLEVFHKECSRVIKYYKKEGILCRVNGEQSPEKVYAEVKKCLSVHL